MEGLTCSICLSDFDIVEDDPDSKPFRLPCSHIFHLSCAKEWTDKTKSCPYCRKDFSSSTTEILTHDHTITILLNQIKALKIATAAMNNTQQQSPQPTTTNTTPPPITQVPLPPTPTIIPTPTPIQQQPITVTNTTLPLPQTIGQSERELEIKQERERLLNMNHNNNNYYEQQTTPTLSKPSPSYYYQHEDPLLAGLIKDSYSGSPTSSKYDPKPIGVGSSNLNSSIKKYMNTDPTPIMPLSEVYKLSNMTVTSSPPSTVKGTSKPKHPHVLRIIAPPPHKWTCSYCYKDGIGYSELYQCVEGCPDFNLCRGCAKESRSVPSLTDLKPFDTSLHHHPLYSMYPSEIYHSGAKCDVCKSNVSNSYIYHCTTCTNFDCCSKCFDSEFTRVSNEKKLSAPIGSSPTSTFSNYNNNYNVSFKSTPSQTKLNRIEPDLNENLPEQITTRYHRLPLIKLQTPLSVYNHCSWSCNVCGSHHDQTWETFYHEGNFDMCLKCYYNTR